jgi:nucleoid-associated protein YejK
MNSTESLKKDVLKSLNLTLKITNSSSLEELDNLIEKMKPQEFLNFLEEKISALNPEEKNRLERFLSARKSYLEMKKESKP